MMILGLSCSPRETGNTVTMVQQALDGAREEGADTEIFSVSGKQLEPCDGCWTCLREGSCHIEDDMKLLGEKMVAADGIIFSTPVYVYGMTGQAKIILDRMSHLNLANKVGGVIVVAGSLGSIDPIKDLYFNMIIKKMLPANLVAIYGNNQGDVEKMTQGMQAAYDLGREMVQIAALGFKYPRGFKRNFHAFGTHTH